MIISRSRLFCLGSKCATSLILKLVQETDYLREPGSVSSNPSAFLAYFYVMVPSCQMLPIFCCTKYKLHFKGNKKHTMVYMVLVPGSITEDAVVMIVQEKIFLMI